MGEKFVQWIITVATFNVAVTFFAISWHFLQDLSYIQYAQNDAWISRMIGMIAILIMAYLPYYFALKLIKRMDMPYFGYGAVIALIMCDVGVRSMILVQNHMQERGLMIFIALSTCVILIVCVIYILDRCISRVDFFKKKVIAMCAQMLLWIDPRSDQR
jgi:hypothetical protein